MTHGCGTLNHSDYILPKNSLKTVFKTYIAINFYINLNQNPNETEIYSSCYCTA